MIFVVIAAALGGGLIFLREWRSAKKDTVKVIDTLLENAEEELGCALDAKSLVYLTNHPFLSAKVWKALGAFGKSVFSSGAPGHGKTCQELLAYVENERFGKKYPCATALFQYTVYLCDSGRREGPRCKHPKEEIHGKSEDTP